MGAKTPTSIFLIIVAILMLASSVVLTIISSVNIANGNISNAKTFSTWASIIGSLSLLPLIPVIMDVYSTGSFC